MKLASTLILALLTATETDPLGLAGGPHSRSAFGQAIASSHDVDRILARDRLIASLGVFRPLSGGDRPQGAKSESSSKRLLDLQSLLSVPALSRSARRTLEEHRYGQEDPPQSNNGTNYCLPHQS